MTPQSSTTPRGLRVLLCHATQDKAAVRDLYQHLLTAGFTPWLDEEDILPGEDWRQAIEKAVRQCDVFLVCLSNRSTSKEGYVQREIKLALDVADEKPEDTIFIIPVRLEECVVPNRISQWHWVDLFSAKGYERLVRALHKRAETLGLEPKAQDDDVVFPIHTLDEGVGKVNSALSEALPTALPNNSTGVAKLLLLLTKIFNGEITSANAVDVIGRDTELVAAIKGLAGQQVQAKGGIVSFGSASQFGDVSIGAVAGRDIIKVTVNFSSPDYPND